MSELLDVFKGQLPLLIDNFVAREAQMQFAESIATILSEGGNGLIEAGTGIGKTFGYLIPIMRSGRTAIISTGTRNLQDQIMHKDLPVVADLFPDRRVSLLKGRANYLCLQRMKTSLKVVEQGAVLERLVDVRSWASRTRTGDLTELVDPEEQPETLRLVTSTKDNCLGSHCPDFDDCLVYGARAKAAQSDVVVVNHHLLFADLAQQEDSLQSLLPHADVVLVDEAHRVTDVARQFFGRQVSSGQLGELIRDMTAELVLLGSDDPLTQRTVSSLASTVDKLKREILMSDQIEFGRWREQHSSDPLLEVDLALNDLISQLDRVAERSIGLQHLQKRALNLADLFAMLTEEVGGAGDFVHWIDRRENGFSIYLSPVSIADRFRGIMQASGASWIFTSATLSLDNGFDHIQTSMGLESAETQRFLSPFDYKSSVRAWLPTELPTPGGEEHTQALVNAVKPLISCNDGRTFFLFTSYRAMRQAALMLVDTRKPILVQGSMLRSRLSQTFVETPGAVLLATQSFWEGVDFKGADVRCLIIDKLPFPNPADPVYAAEAAQIEENGGDSFAELALPRTVLALKQGFGRLIRQESDRGLFVLGDSRLGKRGYRRFVIGNLPEMKWLESVEDATDWLRAL